jgi:hypothetical protein
MRAAAPVDRLAREARNEVYGSTALAAKIRFRNAGVTARWALHVRIEGVKAPAVRDGTVRRR